MWGGARARRDAGPISQEDEPRREPGSGRSRTIAQTPPAARAAPPQALSPPSGQAWSCLNLSAPSPTFWEVSSDTISV